MPLGSLRRARYEDIGVSLDTGSTLVLYTNGLVERPGEPLVDPTAGAQVHRTVDAAVAAIDDAFGTLLQTLEGTTMAHLPGLDSGGARKLAGRGPVA